MTDKSHKLYLDQHGAPIFARSVKELCEKAGGSKAQKMYVDKISGPLAGKSVHCGYIVGSRQFTTYLPDEHVE